MVSTQTVSALQVRKVPAWATWLQEYFYLCMSWLIAGVIVYGFGHTVDSRLIHASPPRPTLLWVHAVLFSSWVIFYISQSLLVRLKKVRIHRTLGWAGAALGASMVVVGPLVALVMARFDTSQLHRANRDAFLIVPLSDIAVFAMCFGLAILWRDIAA